MTKNRVLSAQRSEMPKVSKRSRRKKKRTVDVTFAFTPDEIDLLERAAAAALEPRATWGYRRLVLTARMELGLDPAPKKPVGS